MSRQHRSLSGRFAPGVLAGLLLLALLCATSFADSPAAPAAAAKISPVSSAEYGTADSGDTAWMLASCALVMVMMPGLALFYAGMVRRKNVLGTMMHSMAALGIIGVEWVVIGYAVAFGASFHGIFGWDSHLLFLHSVTPDLIHKGTHTPELVFIMFQGMFAIITPALITGAFAERVKFSAFALFTLLWGLFVYNPLAHWVWAPGGWLGNQGGIGAIDFAGGTVVHISAGVSALVAILIIGKRIGYPQHVLQPNALVLTLLGAGLLWFGWFGFNGGSAVGANGSAAIAFTNTQIAAAAGGLVWMLIEWAKHRRPTSVGFASGLVAGLVAITPASGFVPPFAAIIIGAAAALVCFGAVMAKARLGYDDSLDAFGVHGVGGFLGALLTGVFAAAAYGGTSGLVDSPSHPRQVLIQLIAAASAAAFAALGTFVLVTLVDRLIGFRISRTEEIEGMDLSVHGEQGWMLEQMPAPAVELPGSVPAEREMPPVRNRSKTPSAS